MNVLQEGPGVHQPCSLIGCCCLQGRDMGCVLAYHVSAVLGLQRTYGLHCRAVTILLMSSVLIAIPAWYSQCSSQRQRSAACQVYPTSKQGCIRRLVCQGS